jgi:hypothetical protein
MARSNVRDVLRSKYGRPAPHITAEHYREPPGLYRAYPALSALTQGAQRVPVSDEGMATVSSPVPH